VTHSSATWLICIATHVYRCLLHRYLSDEAIVCNVTHAYGPWLDSFISTNMTHSRRPWLIHVWHDPLILPLTCVDGFCIAIHEEITCDVTHSYGPGFIRMRQDSNIASHMCTRLWHCLTQARQTKELFCTLLHVKNSHATCDVTHSYGPWLIHMTSAVLWTLGSNVTLPYSRAWHTSFICEQLVYMWPCPFIHLKKVLFSAPLTVISLLVLQRFSLFVVCFGTECEDCKVISSDKCVILNLFCVASIGRMVWQWFALCVVHFCIECEDCKVFSSDKDNICLFICSVGMVVWCGNDSYFLKFVCSTECEYCKVISTDNCIYFWFFCVMIIGLFVYRTEWVYCIIILSNKCILFLFSCVAIIGRMGWQRFSPFGSVFSQWIQILYNNLERSFFFSLCVVNMVWQQLTLFVVCIRTECQYYIIILIHKLNFSLIV